ncbi:MULTISPECIES: hypothetical protein [Gammaproteobacteria]|uniref:hypothetical protein n=1 Tax=Gammaproteobacteria TaxID=1236 RepID=UPI000DCFE054|nr:MULTISPECIES: hypothetical protein [Gammaproteobacteria]RTE85930.1 hypothetical protein DQX04_10835 [Aliidiomarina sp. B3213]TCZ90071.1 hypothetical protein EYQ95_09630 [Lysobacter sp. N42]
MLFQSADLKMIIKGIFLAVCGLFFSSFAHGSTALGVNWYSIIDIPSNGMVLQVSHLYLGAGDKRAFFELEGCSDQSSFFEIEKDSDGLRYFSEFELEHCDFSGEIRLTMYFEEIDGELREIDSYTPKLGYVEAEAIEVYSASCRTELFYMGQTPEALLNRSVEVQVVNNGTISTINAFEVKAGHFFKFDHKLENMSCETITELRVGNVNLVL